MPKREFITKAHALDAKTAKLEEYKNWYVSRKYNGFDVSWDGFSVGMLASDIPWYKKGADKGNVISTGFWSSRGKVVQVPEHWSSSMPRGVPLQGEVWCNDSKWYAAVCNSKDVTDLRWMSNKFIVFNSKPYCLWDGIDSVWPDAKNSMFYENKPFKERATVLISAHLVLQAFTLPAFVQHAECVYEVTLQDYLKLYGLETIAEALDFAVNPKYRQNWEGLMLQNPEAPYEDFRTKNLLKLKPSYETEATIVAHNEGTGRHRDRMGSLVVELTWDEKVTGFHGGGDQHVGQTVQFNVGGGFTDEEREWDYVNATFPIGSQINFTFNEVGANGAIPSASYACLFAG